MDPGLVPPTAPGKQLRWLMSLEARPSVEEIEDHLDPGIRAAIFLPGRAAEEGLASGLLAFGITVRELPGALTHSEVALMRLELRDGAKLLSGEVSIETGHGRIILLGLRERPAEGEAELDRVRLLYDQVAPAYERLGASRGHYWDCARSWLEEVAGDGFTVLDVGCGPGHFSAGLAASVHVIGCDASPEMVRMAALARPTGTFVVHDYHQPFPAEWPPADVTIALGCLEFCSDLTQVARNLAAATKPGGRLLLTVPRSGPISPEHEVTLHPLPLLPLTLHLWEDAEVEAAFRAARLDVVAHEIGPGFTSPEVGTVEYGYWDLKAASAGVEVQGAHSGPTRFL